MARTSQWLFVVLAMLLCGCSGDDDKLEEQTASPELQVMTVFAPGQLGDQGYADRVMKGVSQLKQSATGDAAAQRDGLDVEFIASFDVETTCSQLAAWAASPVSPITGTAYSRRLLVLTEPFMGDWLLSVAAQLQPTDEVLLLKVSEADVADLAQRTGLGSRLHGLNISAASGVRHFVEAIRQYEQYIGQPQEMAVTSLPVMRLYSETVVAPRDSIGETLSLLMSHQGEREPLNIIDVVTELYDTELSASAFQSAYVMCAFIHSIYANLGRSDAYAIADLGAAASGAEFYLAGHNDDWRLKMLLLDAEPVAALHRMAITRHFDRALTEWVGTWSQSAMGSMPQMEKHGGWDGYCTDDITVTNFLLMTR